MFKGRSKRKGRGFARFVAESQRRQALPWTGLAGLRLCGKKLYEVYGSVQNQVDLALEMEKQWDADFTGIMDDGIICSETLGLKIKKYDYDFPAVGVHPITDKASLAGLSVPDPLAPGRMRLNIQSIQALSQRSDKPVAISIEGPFTLAGQLAGVEHLAKSIIADPGFVLDLLDFTSRVVREYARAVCRAGADLVSIAEPTAIILSEKQFTQFVVPFVQKVFKDLDAWKVMHICGDTRHLLDAMLSCGPEGLSLDQIMDIPGIMDRIPEDIVVFGNIDPLEVMLEMDAQGVAQKTKALLSAMDPYPNFIMSTGCDCVLETRFDNLRALVQTTHDHLRNKTASRSAPSGTAPTQIVPKKATLPISPQITGLIPRISQAVVDYDQKECCRLCEQSIEKGINPFEVMEQGLATGMETAGNLFESDIYFIPELLMSADTLYAGLSVLKPRMIMEDIKIKAKLLIGVIEGDIHEIGKNLVITMFTAAGWEVCDLGPDVSTRSFVRAYQEHKPDLVGISALMNTSMGGIPSTINALRSINPDVKIMVGGAPITHERALSFGADAYAANAVQAVQEGVKLLGPS